MKIVIAPALALVALAACGSQPPEPDADSAVVAPAADSPPPIADRADAVPVAAGIPSAIRGRWGMVAADCDPERDDAKGLLTITATRLEFYESVGTLDAIAEAADTRVRAGFDFTGEGMEWERDMLLEVQDNGSTLIRREYGADAAPEPFRYTRCT